MLKKVLFIILFCVVISVVGFFVYLYDFWSLSDVGIEKNNYGYISNLYLSNNDTYSCISKSNELKDLNNFSIRYKSKKEIILNLDNNTNSKNNVIETYNNIDLLPEFNDNTKACFSDIFDLNFSDLIEYRDGIMFINGKDTFDFSYGMLFSLDEDLIKEWQSKGGNGLFRKVDKIEEGWYYFVES